MKKVILAAVLLAGLSMTSCKTTTDTETVVTPIEGDTVVTDVDTVMSTDTISVTTDTVQSTPTE